MSRSDSLPSRPAFVRYPLKSLGTSASLCAGPREHSGAIGDARARSEPLGSPRSSAYPARAPHLAELWTVMLRGPLPHLGVEPASRGVIRRGRGARSTETFPLARPGAACTPTPARISRVLGLQGARATPTAHPTTSRLGRSCPQVLSRRQSHSCLLLSALQCWALQPQFLLLVQRGVMD